MALIKCSECGREVSTQAKKCPQCGAKIKKPKKPVSSIVALFVVAMGAFIIYGVIKGNQQRDDKQSVEAARVAALTPEQRAQEKADSSKRGAQLQLGAQGALALKHAAKDPEAFELRSAVVKLDGATCYNYRAKNSFGAVMPGEAVLSKAGHIYIKEQDEGGFARVWNKECTVSGGDEVADTIKRLGILE
jgi:DNA-directed RNA polymerase subunit RPC12/RpoP